MATVIQPSVKQDLLRYGAVGMDLCFNCGNCTAVCPLSLDGTSFPRKLVRYAQLGLQDKLASAPEPWLCYYCGECSATCPREATPGETMAALRRNAIAAYDVTGLAGLMFKFPAFAVFFTLALGVLLGFFHLSIQAGKHATEPAHWTNFTWIPYEVIHHLGVAVGGLMTLIVLAGLFNAARLMLKPHGGFAGLRQHPFADYRRALAALGREISTMKRHAECKADTERGEPWYRQPRFAHGTIMGGFFMLLAATTLDFIFVFLLKIEFYGIARPLGIVGGLVMLYGLLVYTANRLKGASPNTRTTTLADAWLLFFLIVLDVTGFALLLIVTFGWKGLASDVILLVHSVMAMELVLMFTVTKIGHALYRPMALFIHFLKQPQPAA
jgi:ferredoxin